MEVLVEFLPFLLFLLYAVLRVLRGRKPTPQGAAPYEDEDRDDASPRPQTDLDELARHLESLLTGEPVQPPPPPERRQLEPEFQNAEVAVDESASFRHQEHGFGAQNPLSEETFERLPAFAQVRAPVDPSYDPHGLKRPPAKASAPTSGWRARLADPKRAREAFVLQTILERPQDRRR